MPSCSIHPTAESTATCQKPERIVCLSAETADWLWRIGAWDQVCGTTVYFSPPAEAEPKPQVSGFSSANLAEITSLDPDLVITFSDVQADIAARLIKQGLTVLSTNQRTLAQVEATLLLIGRMTGHEARSIELLNEFMASLEQAPRTQARPRVYFEEWHTPMVTGIAWVSELIERAGGVDIFRKSRSQRAATDRVVNANEVLKRDPDIIVASWCGEPVDIEMINSREGWDRMSAVRNGQVFEIPSDDILQPGLALVDGFRRLKEIIDRHNSADMT